MCSHPHRTRSPIVAAITLFALACGIEASPVRAADTPPVPLASPSTAAPATLDTVRALLRISRLPQAETAARDLVRRLSGAAGTDSVDLAEALQALLDVLARAVGPRSPEFQSLAERSLALFERFGSPDDLRLAGARQHMAAVLRARNQPLDALALYRSALALQERVLGPDDLEVSRTLNRMGGVHRAMGDRAAARAALERALRIREAKLPQDHRDIAFVLGNLALFDQEEGDYALARERFRRVLGINEASEGVDGLQVGLTLLNLATLENRLGEPEAARVRLERAARILASHLGPRRWEVLVARSNLATTLLTLHEPARAETILVRAIADFDSSRMGSLDVRAEMLVGLATARRDVGRFDSADSLFHEATAVQQRVLAPDHWIVAQTLRAHAETDLARGDVAAARGRFDRALAIDRATFGEAHPAVAEDLAGRALSALRAGDLAVAFTDALRADRIGCDHLRLTARSLPESKALEYAAVRARGTDVALSALAAAASGGRPGEPTGAADAVGAPSIADAWDAVIRSRAVVLDEMAARHHALAEAGDPAVRELARRSADRRQQIANLFVRGAGDSAAAFRALLAAHLRAADSADAALAERSVDFRRERARADAGLREVREGLPAGSALLAFVRYERHEPLAGESGAPTASARQPRPPSVPGYLAFVARPGREDVAVPLAAAAAVDSLVVAWREAAVGPGDRARRDAVRRGSGSRTEASDQAPGAALRERIWDPIEPLLEGADRVLIVPDGALHLVAFGALPSREGGYLVEAGRVLHYLSAERDLARPVDARPTGNLLTMGGAEFDRAPSSAKPSPDPPRGAARAVHRSAAPDCAAFATQRFAALPATAREATEVAALWRRARPHGSDAILATGLGASEDAFKGLAPGAGAIHVATHGYFLGERCITAGEVGSGVAVSPMLLSGLALAGANLRRQAPADGEDGVLTAEEIAALDLTGVGTVALSACHTGVGTVLTGEGVFGLRRAFEVAGARSLVLSLWQVGDLDARRWMRAFYEARLGRDRGVAEAVHEASLRMLRSLRAAREDDSPARWGAFIASGDWR